MGWDGMVWNAGVLASERGLLDHLYRLSYSPELSRLGLPMGGSLRRSNSPWIVYISLLFFLP